MARRELAAALGEWALVEYVRQNSTLHALTLVDGRVRVRRLVPPAGVSDQLERLTFALRRHADARARPAQREAAAQLLRSAAERLDAQLLHPLSEVDGRPLVVVPTGSLHSLPWSLLPSGQGRPVAVALSATLWHAAQSRAAAGGPVIAVAGPRLPAAGPEAEAVAAIHGGTALTGARASVAAVQAALGSAELMHLAAHGRLSAENPLFSDVALADGPLMIYDIERAPFVPHTLVLAACDSGRPVVRTGDEVLGLGVAFLARGTAQLVASVLPIPDAPTAHVMIAFHKRVAYGRPVAAALAEAQQALHGDGAEMTAAAAGFVCIGAGTHPLFRPAGGSQDAPGARSAGGQ